MFNSQQRNWNKRIFREPSIAINSAWTTIEEYLKPHFETVNALKPGFVGVEHESGKVFPYLKAIDKTKPGAAVVLKNFEGDFPQGQTIDDEVMRRIAKENKADIFTTDTVVAILMASQMSVYSWDLIVQKFKDKLFIDIREDPNILHLLTVNENTQEKTPNDDATENGARQLMEEARRVNDDFMYIGINTKGEPLDSGNEDPFIEDEDQITIQMGYAYKIFNLGTKKVCVRCSRHTYAPNSWDDLTEEQKKERAEQGIKPPARQFMSLHTLLEYENQKGNEWKQMLQKNQAMIMNQSLQYNQCKIHRWILQALISDAEQMKFAFVGRKNPAKTDKHVVLQTFTRNTADFAKEQGVSLPLAWGYFRFFCDEIYAKAEEETGDYMIYKDPSKHAFRLYKVTQEEDMEEQD